MRTWLAACLVHRGWCWVLSKSTAGAELRQARGEKSVHLCSWSSCCAFRVSPCITACNSPVTMMPTWTTRCLPERRLPVAFQALPVGKIRMEHQRREGSHRPFGRVLTRNTKLDAHRCPRLPKAAGPTSRNRPYGSHSRPKVPVGSRSVSSGGVHMLTADDAMERAYGGVPLTQGARAAAWPPGPTQVSGVAGSSPWLTGLPPAVVRLRASSFRCFRVGRGWPTPVHGSRVRVQHDLAGLCSELSMGRSSGTSWRTACLPFVLSKGMWTVSTLSPLQWVPLVR